MNPGGDSQNDMDESNRMEEEPSHFEALQAVDMSLTKEQYMVIQHMLPKQYSLIEHRHIKKGGVVTSAIKLAPEDVLSLSLRLRTYLECRETQKTWRGGRSASE